MNLEEIVAFANREFESFRVEKEIPGVAFGIIHNGKLVYASGLGERVLGSQSKPQAETVFRIASMTKSFTAAAILKLRDRGLLELDTPITTYLPWTATIGVPANSAPITIRDLLTMGAGLPTDDPWGDRQESLPLSDFDEMVKAGLTFNRNVNTGFEYSNLSYALLGRIISQVTGEIYEDFMEREIFSPLGMHASTFISADVSDEYRALGYANFASGLTAEPFTTNGAFTPMGGLHSSVSDLAKWVLAFQSGRTEQQTPYRYAQSVVAKEFDGCPERIVVSSYGFGLFIDDDAKLGRFIHHSGGYPGFGSHMRWHPDSGFGIVALGNVTYAPMIFACQTIMNHIAALHMNSGHRKVELGTATEAAMKVVNNLINTWDDAIASEWFTENMDLDRPRAERIADLQKLTSGKGAWKVVDGSLTGPTRSFAKWTVESDGSTVEVEMLMSPEKSPKIQKLTFKSASESKAS
jgi:CubicO group peptidase (beta-lactamase class C family)